MNNVSLLGTVCNTRFEEAKRKKEKPRLRFNLGVYNPSSGDTQFIPCVIFINTDEHEKFVTEQITDGKRLALVGRISYKNENVGTKENPEWENYFSIIVERTYFAERKGKQY